MLYTVYILYLQMEQLHLRGEFWKTPGDPTAVASKNPFLSKDPNCMEGRMFRKIKTLKWTNVPPIKMDHSKRIG